MRTWLLALLLLLASSTAWADRVDRVVAVVDSQLVLESEVRLEHELSRLDTGASPFWRARRAAVERLIDAAAVRVAAGQVVLYQPPDEEVRTRRDCPDGRVQIFGTDGDKQFIREERWPRSGVRRVYHGRFAASCTETFGNSD